MSNERSEKYYCKFRKHHFLLLSYEHHKQTATADKYRHNHKICGKSKCDSVSAGGGRGGRISVSWILCCILLKLLCVNIKLAETLNTALLQNSSDAVSLAIATATNTTILKSFLEDETTFSERGRHSTLSEMEKEVGMTGYPHNLDSKCNLSKLSQIFFKLSLPQFERLIKEWAPVVWLAPEEKFMPLGVEEFLAHVHPESKDNSFTPGMSFGENSQKSFLVTNIEIDQLLENDTSFIYGRNPNISPVPIYAVVALCTQHQNRGVEQHLEGNFLNSKPIKADYSPQSHKSIVQQNFHHTNLEAPSPTRGPYIPVTLGPEAQVDSNLRRSSRLYPMFQRIKRSLTSLPNASSVPRYDLVTGESVYSTSADRLRNSESGDVSDGETEKENVNNFIANLVDNVKFSVPFTKKDEDLKKATHHIMSGYAYIVGTKIPSFHVTYWMFYPYSQGKNMCTLSLGPFGRIPFPAVYGYCLGRKKDIGSHIGDWEHMTLYFTGLSEPEAMYVSAHDAGAYYAYNRLTGSFEFKRQETRKGILQRPTFPKTVTTFNDHPVLFAAKGSHGLWTAPGKHRFVKVARLYDINGFGTPWNTWKHVQITYENVKPYGRAFAPSWLSFKGKWGNPKSKCHPLRRIGLNFCEFTDGPTGIPLKEPHFQCDASFRR